MAAVEVVTTDEFAEWFDELDDVTAEKTADAVELLETFGVTLPFPHSSDIKGTTHPIRELRFKASKHQIRVFYAFDPTRDAVLILGGDKTGDDRFYETMLPQVERIWLEYLEEQKKELQQKK